jgi:light-regulated signal transduction histidine kinase (bacteriophytochrome)
VPIVPPDRTDTGPPLDLSLSTLRSVSPVHIQYLRNMGVRATLTISLLRDERLIGLIACHHRAPRLLSLRLRRICELIGRVLSLQIELRERQEESDQRLGAGMIIARMVERASGEEDLGKGLLHGTPSLLDLVPAGGAAIVDDNRLDVLGGTPPPKAIRAIVQWLRGHMEGSLFATECLSDHLPWTSNIADTAAGLLAIGLSRGEGLFALWFRPEFVHTVAWGGDPQKPATVNPRTQRLEPRGSFEVWKEEVRAHARPWSAWELSAAEDMRGAVVGIVLRRAAELSRLNVELKSAVRARDDFLSMASHELRTPIATLKLAIQALVRTAERSPERFTLDWARPRLDTAMRQVERTAELVDDLLDISRITSGRLVLELSDVDLSQIVRQSVARFEDALEEAGYEVTLDLAPGVVGRWDPTRLDQVVANLISNALKYGAGKPITVTVARQAYEGILRVRDQGIGIAKEAQARIFERFERAVSAGQHTGFGLGLWIVRQLVEQMGGTVSVTSVEGQGSTFEVRLPIARKRETLGGEVRATAGEPR